MLWNVQIYSIMPTLGMEMEARHMLQKIRFPSYTFLIFHKERLPLDM